MIAWIITAEQRPTDGQQVIYWFAPGNSAHVGYYYESDDTFSGRSGFCDHHDATHWIEVTPP